MSLVRPYNRPVAEKVITDNRRARHEYHLLERHEAGMVLTGTEVKSLRQGRITLGSAYADVRDGELWLIGAHIDEYDQGNLANHEPDRDRKSSPEARSAHAQPAASASSATRCAAGATASFLMLPRRSRARSA
jgi:hypothetical protein